MAEDTISRAFSRTGTVASLVQLPGLRMVGTGAVDAAGHPWRRRREDEEQGD